MSKYTTLLCTPVLTVMCVCFSAEAQVRENTRVTPADQTIVGRNRSSNTYQIRGGARRGNNLFHTFSEFRPNSSNVDFILQPTINNVFALVQGRRPTRIGANLNLIEQISGGPHSANFFLIDPRGITLNPGAVLNVSGDLFLSTANSIGFGAQGRLALTSNPEIPLLTANPLHFAFRRNSSGAIRINGGQPPPPPQVSPPSSVSILASSIDVSNSMVMGNNKVVLGALRQGRYFTEQLNNNLVSQNVIGGDINLSATQIFGFGSIDVLADGNLTLGSDSDIASFDEGDIHIDVAGTIQLEPAIVSNAISNDRGNIDIQASRIKIGKNSSINVTSLENLPEAAGDISIFATRNIDLNGENSSILASTINSIDGEAADNIDDFTFAGTNNDAGNISITTPLLNLNNNASIRVSSGDDMGSPGDLRINAQRVVLNQGFLTTETGNLQGPNAARGNIFLNVSDAITLRNSSQITALARGTSGGGNIFILNTPILRSVQGGDPLGTGNDIVADSFTGPGGNIIINTQGEPIGFNAPRFDVSSGQEDTPRDGENDITATGLDPGFIDIDTLTEVNQGNVEFPKVVTDPNSLIAQNSCSRGSESEFTLSGKGGLADNVRQSSDSTRSQVSPVQLPNEAESMSQDIEIVNHTNSSFLNPRNLNLIAQGWVYDQAGNINLIAHRNDIIPDSPRHINNDRCSRNM